MMSKSFAAFGNPIPSLRCTLAMPNRSPALFPSSAFAMSSSVSVRISAAGVSGALPAPLTDATLFETADSNAFSRSVAAAGSACLPVSLPLRSRLMISAAPPFWVRRMFSSPFRVAAMLLISSAVRPVTTIGLPASFARTASVTACAVSPASAPAGSPTRTMSISPVPAAT